MTIAAEQAKAFVWLLRDDVRRTCASLKRPDDEFRGWWAVRGRMEYPHWAELATADVEWLRESTGKLNLADGVIDIPRALRLAALWRPDVRQHYAKAPHAPGSAVDALALAGWFYAIGITEHQLGALITPHWVRDLDRPVQPSAPAPESAAAPGLRAPAMTVLMLLMWHFMPAPSRALFDWQQHGPRLRYMAHFFRAVCRSPSLQMLLANRWRSWLLQDPSPDPSGELWLPWFARISGPVASTPAPGPAGGAGGFAQRSQWARKALEPGGTWSWLRKTAALQSQPAKTASFSTDAVGVRGGAHNAHAAGAVTTSSVTGTRPFGINLYGFAYGELGIGEDVRMAAQACDAAGIPYRVVNVDPGDQVRQADRALEAQIARAEGAALYAFNVFCVPAFDMVSRIALRDGPAAFEGHYNIGWWPWELPVWPRRWAGAFDLVDEVWAASRFTQAMYAASTPKPVTPMPLAVSVDRLQTISRRSLGLPAKRFLFLFIFDFNSHLARKNPEAVLDAFAAAFDAKDARVGLVIKTMNTRPDNPVWERFAARCAADRRITLMQHTLDRGHVLGLVQSCDAYVSLHRSEGFGRTLAEALLLGKPVVATDFSGTADFITDELAYPVRWTRRALVAGDYPFVEPDDAAWWAEPDVAHAAAQMRAARADSSPERAEAIRSGSADVFSPQRVGRLMRQRLQGLAATPALRVGVQSEH